MDDFDALVLVEAVPSMNLPLFAAAVTTDERVAQRPALAALLLALRGMPSPVPVTGRSRTPMDHLLAAIGAARRCTVADAICVARVCNAAAGDQYSPVDLLTVARAKTLLTVLPEHLGTGAGWPLRAVAAAMQRHWPVTKRHERLRDAVLRDASVVMSAG